MNEVNRLSEMLSARFGPAEWSVGRIVFVEPCLDGSKLIAQSWKIGLNSGEEFPSRPTLEEAMREALRLAPPLTLEAQAVGEVRHVS